MVSWSWSGAAALFDMDGTLVDSGASVLRAWQWTAERLDLPFSVFAPYLHGIPADQVLDRVASYLPTEVRASALPREVRASVVEEMLARQAEDTSGVVAVPGAAAALAALPSSRWAVVTSADRRLAESRLRAAGLLVPQHLVTAELTVVGKPSAEPYLYAARVLGARPDECLVVEDSIAGVRSGRAAGCRVLGLRTSVDELADVDWLVSDLTEVEFRSDDIGVSARSDAVS